MIDTNFQKTLCAHFNEIRYDWNIISFPITFNLDP